MLNKYLFGLLVNTIAIFASISGDVVATEDLHDFRSELNQIAWEGQCSFREICIARHSDSVGKESEKKNAWILDQEYEESRTKVIGEAIGDCIAGKKEFAKKGPNDIITFDETEPKDYEPEHWNAVILYNYIHEAINGELKSTKVAEVLKKKLEKIKNYYIDYYTKKLENNIENTNQLIDDLTEKLENAIQEIQAYVDALHLPQTLADLFKNNKQRYDSPKWKNVLNQDAKIRYIAPDVDWEYANNKELRFDFGFSKFNTNTPDERLRYMPTFRCHENKLFIAQLKIELQYWEGNSLWSTKKTQYITSIDELNRSGGWLLKRLTGLVEIPDPELWEWWNGGMMKALRCTLAV